MDFKFKILSEKNLAEIDKITKKVKKDYYYISDKPVSVTEFVFCKRECP